MRRIFKLLIALGLALALPISVFATVSIVPQGGTGTSTFPVGQLLYGSGANPVQSASTSTLGVINPITFSGTLGFQVGGVNGLFGCLIASGSQTGCLSSTDWNTFNSKGSGSVTSVATNNGLTGGTITTTGTIGLDISKLSVGGLTAWNGTQLAATGTPTLYAGNFVSTSTAVASIFPYASTTMVTASIASSTDLYISGLGRIAGTILATDSTGHVIATTTPSSGGSSSTGPLNIIQASNGSGGFIATGTPNLTAGFFTATTTTPSNLRGGLTAFSTSTIGDGTAKGGLSINGGATTTGNAYFASRIGIGTTSPQAILSLFFNTSNILTNNTPAFLIASTSKGIAGNQPATTTLFVVTPTNKVGIGTTTPMSNLSVQADSSFRDVFDSNPVLAVYGAARHTGIIISGGQSDDNGQPTTIQAAGGNAGGFNGGDLNLIAGLPTTSATPGNINITTPNVSAFGTNSGDININTGTPGIGGTTGRVLINTSNSALTGVATVTPDSTLDVNGTFRLEGTASVESPSIGGAIIGTGCDTGDTTSSGLASTTALVTTPESDPGGAVSIYSLILNTTKIRTFVCTGVTLTPNTIKYRIKIIR